jgi:preprotein translocase subunit Sec63
MALAKIWGVPLSPEENPEQDYELLGLNPDAGDGEVRQAFRALASHFHPDTAAALTPTQQQEAEEAFMRIRNAFERICRLRGM